MKIKKHPVDFLTDLRDDLEISLVGNASKSSVIIRQILEVLIFSPEVMRFSLRNGAIEVRGSELSCAVFCNRSFRITGHIQMIGIMEKERAKG